MSYEENKMSDLIDGGLHKMKQEMSEEKIFYEKTPVTDPPEKDGAYFTENGICHYYIGGWYHDKEKRNRAYPDFYLKQVNSPKEEVSKLHQKVFRFNTAWNLRDILGRLIYGVDYLLHVKDYDREGHEEMLYAMNAAKEVHDILINNHSDNFKIYSTKQESLAFAEWIYLNFNHNKVRGDYYLKAGSKLYNPTNHLKFYNIEDLYTLFKK